MDIITYALIIIIIVLLARFATGKNIDLIQNYENVRECCCFESATSNERGNIRQQMVTLQKALPEGYKFTSDDEKDFIEVYKEYRTWLLEKYINRYYSISTNYPNYYSRKYRKTYKIQNLEDIYGDQNVLFLAKTLEDFLSENVRKQNELNLSAHKMLLATQCIQHIAGWSSMDVYIEIEKKAIDQYK